MRTTYITRTLWEGQVIGLPIIDQGEDAALATHSAEVARLEQTPEEGGEPLTVQTYNAVTDYVTAETRVHHLA